MIGEVLALSLMAFALGMDAFSVGLGMGMFKLRLRQIFKIGITIGIFHVWMPLLGIAAGKFLSNQFGAIAGYIGGVLLLVLGLQMILASFQKEESRFITPVGFGLLFCIKRKSGQFFCRFNIRDIRSKDHSCPHLFWRSGNYTYMDWLIYWP